MNLVGHHDISFQTGSGLFMMQFGSTYHKNETIESLQENIWPAIQSLESKNSISKTAKPISIQYQNAISKITKPRTWLETIEDRVLILNFVKPAIGEWQRNDAITLSFFGMHLLNVWSIWFFFLIGPFFR